VAETNIFKYTLLQDVSPFSANDIIQVRWDDVAEAIVVFRNESLESSGPDLGLFGIDFALRTSNYTFCEGLNLVFFTLTNNPEFPYAIKNESIGDAACVAVACDLFTQIIRITNADEGLSNGFLSVVGTSSFPTVEYGLIDFIHGTGQTTGEFINLSAGEYTVWVRDGNNCLIKQPVTVGVVLTHGVLHRAEWVDLQGNTHRFDIGERDYVGGVNEKDTGGTPFVYSKPSKGVNKLFEQPIEPSNTTVNLISDTDFLYRDLYTQDERKYRGIWSLNQGAGLVEQWRGFLIPSVFQEPYIIKPYVTSLTFTDGLEDLKKIDYLESGEEIEGVDKAIKIIARVLNKLDLGLGIRCGINIYSGSMNTAASDDPLDQAKIDNKTFFRKGKAFNCHDVLRNILIDFGARIFQWQEFWWIARMEEENSASYDYREFDSLGDFVTNSSHSPKINIDEATVTNRLVFADQDQNYEIYPSYGKITVNNQLHEINLVRNGDFENLLDTGFRFWAFIPNGGNTSLIQKSTPDNNFLGFSNVDSVTNGRDDFITSIVQSITISPSDRLKFSFDFAVDNISSDIPYLSVSYIVKLTLGGTDFFLKDTGSWSEDASYISKFNASPTSDFQTYKIEIDSPLTTGGEVTGTFEIKIHNYHLATGDFGNEIGQSGETQLRAINTTTRPTPYKIDGRTTTASVIRHRFYTLTFGTEADNFPDVVRPDDFDDPDNTVFWQLTTTFFLGVGTISDDSIVSNDEFFIDNVILQLLPNGFAPSTKETLSVLIDDDINENLEIDIELGDVQTEPNRIVNDKNIYDDYYRLADGIPITDWSRDSVSESDTIQTILLKQLSSQFSTTTNKITGSATSLESGGGGIYLGPFNVLVETHDSDKVYHIDGLTISPKTNSYNLELLELKDVATGGGGSSFSGDFNNDFGNSFDTILN